MDKSLINGTSLLNGLVMGIPNGNLVIVNRLYYLSWLWLYGNVYDMFLPDMNSWLVRRYYVFLFQKCVCCHVIINICEQKKNR